MDLATDPYRSRYGDRPQIVERADPVVWGHAESGPLSAEHLASYERDGFFVFGHLLDEELVSEALAEFERLNRDPEALKRVECIREPDSEVVRSWFAVHEWSPVFRRLAAHPLLVDMARQILGGEVLVHQSRINIKPAFHGKPFPWHSDFETWHMEDGMPRMRAVSMSVCLTDNMACNGALMVVPGSHRSYVVCCGETPDEHYRQSLRRQEYGVPDAASLTTLCERGGGIATPTPPAGSVLMFDCNTMHGSAGNLSPYPRTNLFLVYNQLDNRLEAPFCGNPPRPEFLGSRHGTPVGDWNLDG